MVTVAPLMFSPWKMTAAKRLIPAADLIDAQYDTVGDVPTTDVLVLLSTPRSGSTLLCELLRLNDGCLAHEYFQPFQYMQILAQRWGCVTGGIFNDAAYVRALRKHRTSPNGWLGINVHGSHLKHFARISKHFSDVRFHYVHLVREDQVAQAVSYEMATQSKQWSSQFEKRSHAQYSFRRILSKLRVIQNQNALIKSYLIACGASSRTISYEDLVGDTEGTLRSFSCIAPDRELILTPPLQRQASDRSTRWKERFAADVLADQSVPGLGWRPTDRLRNVMNLPRLRIR
ncbi:LPS sulfotransferase NodH [Mycobacterium sp. MAA66]|uniref:Stf0 family sulfotransferase n=1 Tax=Mycobacterium sp. MAA66 TaxID=3156297 RepID=UPI003512A845